MISLTLIIYGFIHPLHTFSRVVAIARSSSFVVAAGTSTNFTKEQKNLQKLLKKTALSRSCAATKQDVPTFILKLLRSMLSAAVTYAVPCMLYHVCQLISKSSYPLCARNYTPVRRTKCPSITFTVFGTKNSSHV